MGLLMYCRQRQDRAPLLGYVCISGKHPEPSVVFVYEQLLPPRSRASLPLCCCGVNRARPSSPGFFPSSSPPIQDGKLPQHRIKANRHPVETHSRGISRVVIPCCMHVGQPRKRKTCCPAP